MLEELGIYLVRKVLEFFVKKYDLKDNRDGLDFVAKKLDSKNQLYTESKKKMTLKEKLIEELIDREGGYVHNSKDKGGATKYGITLKTALKHGYIGDIRKLPLSKAKEIYSTTYWDTNNLDRVVELSPNIAREVFDTGVNMGVGTAGKFLQRCLNLLNKTKIKVDGVVGDKTINALSSFLQKRKKDGEETLLKCLNSLQGAKYIALAEKDPSQREFIYGWLRNRV